MCVDVEPGMRTAAVVAWEAAAKLSLPVLALSLLDRGCLLQQHRVLQQHVRAAVGAVGAAAAGAAPARGGGGSQKAIRPSRRCSRIVSVVHTGYASWAETSCPTESRREKSNEKPTINVKNARQRMHMHLLVRDNTWAGPSNPRAGLRNCRAGPYRARVSWASLPCDGPGRAGPRPLKK